MKLETFNFRFLIGGMVFPFLSLLNWVFLKLRFLAAGSVLMGYSYVRGASKIFVQSQTSIQPGCWLDARQGKIFLGKNSRIRRGVLLSASDGEIIIGDHVSINAYCCLYGQGKIIIGNGVLIAAHSRILSSSHIYDQREAPIFLQGFELKPTRIEDDVWLGTGVTVLGGITIGKDAIIGAGAVVNTSIPPGEIWAGVPAGKIGLRKKGNEPLPPPGSKPESLDAPASLTQTQGAKAR